MFMLQLILEFIHALRIFFYYFFAISRYIGEIVILVGTIIYNSLVDFCEVLIEIGEDFSVLLREWYDSLNAVGQHPRRSIAEPYNYNIIEAIIFISLNVSRMLSIVFKRLVQSAIGRLFLDIANRLCWLLQTICDMLKEICCFFIAFGLVLLVIRHGRSLYREIRQCLEKVRKYLVVILSWFRLQRDTRSELEIPGLIDSTLCVICRDNKKNILLLPCKHLCLCSVCSSLSTMQPLGEICPLCRSQVDTYLRVYT